MRSTKIFDVSKIAKDKNGGGHFHAAGFPIDQILIEEFYKRII